MVKGIKKSYLTISTILVVYIALLLLNIFYVKNVEFLAVGISSTIVFLLMILMFGYEKKAKRFTYETMFYITTYTILYIVATYIIGIFSGFTASIYRLGLSNIMHNILPYMLIIISGEYLRSEVVRKCEGFPIGYILLTICLVLIDSTLFLNTFDLSNGDGQIKFICNILLPSVFKNSFLLYICRIGGVYPTIIYRIITELKMFILPIFPDFGLYIESVLLTMFPVILGFGIYLSLRQYANKEVEGKTYKYSKLYVYASVIVVLLITVPLVMLTSCKFKYGLISIGSGSMTGVINKGDAVFFQEIEDIHSLNINDILVFRKEGLLIVHRIIDIVELEDGDRIFYTKGDANQTPDGYPIPSTDAVGVVKGNIKYIGLPSVMLNEMIKG